MLMRVNILIHFNKLIKMPTSSLKTVGSPTRLIRHVVENIAKVSLFIPNKLCRIKNPKQSIGSNKSLG